MATLNTSDPFGMDPALISQIDWKLALVRIIHDLRSDFIYAPHLSFIYRKAGTELIDLTKKELRSGTYTPGLPLTIEVPKTFRIPIKGATKRLGPNYSRPGSILLPHDRLLYQALADQAAPIIRARSDEHRSFSHLLADVNSESMFLPTRHCWSKLQKALAAYAKPSSVRYVLKLDIANFFGSLNQHTLINTLSDSGYPASLSSRLEVMLTRYTTERSSRGILQGMYPSDLLGNYYLAPIDQTLKELGVSSARYVDDMYIFIKNVDSAHHLLRSIIPTLRSYDLVLNEAKSAVMPKIMLVTEEPDLETLFSDAVREISQQVGDSEFDADYGFQSEWEEEPIDTKELELKATKLLFNSLSEFPGNEENIERFCLPLFSKADSNYAVAHVIDAFKKRPAMAQIYASYLAKFLADRDVTKFLRQLLTDVSLLDWQKMWVLAALSQVRTVDDDVIKAALDVAKDATRHDALRAAAAIYVGRYGDHARRKALITLYSSVSGYMQAAIYYSSRLWPGPERNNAKASWTGHGPLHDFISIAMAKK